MRKLILVLSLAFALSGCALIQPFTQPIVQEEPAVCKPLPESARAACREAADAVIKGYATLAGVNATIKDNVLSGAYSPAYAQSLLDKSVAARKKLDLAHEAFQNGNFAESLSQTNIVNTLLVALTAELAKRAEQEKQ